jgi:FkbM family methyltransferase
MKQGSTIYTFDGRYTIPEWWELYIKSQQIRHKAKIFGRFVSPGDLVFDIGANRGGMTYVFRKQLGCRVVAVEPLHQIAPDHVKEFVYMFKDDDGVTLIPKAVSPEPQVELQMPNLSKHWIITSASERWRTKSAHKHLYRKVIKKTVGGITLDELVERFGVPRFIKVDVEGYGAEVISTLHTPVYSLNMEFHRDWLWNNWQAMKHLATLGDYEYNYVLDNRGDLMLEDWESDIELADGLKSSLTKSGKGSWGDIYARRVK